MSRSEQTAPVLEPLRLLQVVRGADRDGFGDEALRHGLEVTDCTTVVDAAGLLMAGKPPVAIAVQLELVDRNGLELLSVLEALDLRIPVLVFCSRPRPMEVSESNPFVTLITDRGPAALRAAVSDAIDRTRNRPPGPMFRLLDYLRLSVQLSQSIDLRLHLGSGREAQVEIVGGDVWNIYVDGQRGLSALDAVVGESPETLEARHLRLLPAERQVTLTGPEVLRRIRVPAASRRSSSTTRAERAAGTQPINSAVIAAVRQQGSSGGEPESAFGSGGQAAAAADHEADFERHFTMGLAAAFKGDYAEALEAFDQARKLRPADARLLYNIEQVRKRL